DGRIVCIRLSRRLLCVRLEPIEQVGRIGFRNSNNAPLNTLVYESARGSQGERTPGKLRCREREPRLDFLCHFIAQENRPSTGERQPPGWCRFALGQPPALQRAEESIAPDD